MVFEGIDKVKNNILEGEELKPLLSYAIKIDLVEVPDPYYGGDKGFDQVLDLLEVAIDGLIKDIKVD